MVSHFDYSLPDYRLLVMTKSPELGKVKTRMQPGLTQAQSQVLHCALVDQCLTQWQEAQLCPVDLWLAGDTETFYQTLPKFSQWPYSLQTGTDLGERMHNAVRISFAKHQCQGVVLVGSDCPFITASYLRKAMTALQQGADAVIGPALDGGYVLLGLQKPAAFLFSDIEWGTERVFEQTCARLQQYKLTYQCLTPLSDIDHIDDLERLDKPAFSDTLRAFAKR